MKVEILFPEVCNLIVHILQIAVQVADLRK